PVLQLIFGGEIKRNLRKEQLSRGKKNAYAVILWVAFLVFVITLTTVSIYFLPPIARHQNIELKISILAILKIVFLCMGVVKGFGDGLLVGVVKTGRPLPGLTHSLAMILTSILFLYFISTGKLLW
ncbi:MAG: hypothetical protein AB1485_06310, partial [Candidatus Thermoplasmatota archaeon]